MRIVLAVLIVAGVALASKPAKPDPINGLLCGLCIDLVNTLETDIETDGEGPFIDKCNKACDKITKGNPILDPTCRALIDYDIKKVEADIKNKEPAQKVCQKISLC